MKLHGTNNPDHQTMAPYLATPDEVI